MCHTVHNENPLNVVGTVPVWGDQVLLCRRNIEPRYGMWTLPAGFMELGETVEQGATQSFHLKLFVGGLTTPEVLLDQIAQFRADTEERLATYREIEPTNTNRGHDWYHRRLLELGIARAELDLKWADRVARALRRR